MIVKHLNSNGWLNFLDYVSYDENQKKMYCTLCMRHKKKNIFKF
jgi:hypothetical protein